ncbi:SAM-dependent methyltransferase [Phormidium tenue FACHB-886]|nr:SAM-dependent methyltransferase [Phormidium tenue FACHB-886]
MGIQLEQVVPWGRSLAEYSRMFSLSESDLQKSILDCAGGPASFNVELTQHGGHVVSCDPIYQFTSAQIEQRIQETYDLLKAKLLENLDAYIWETIASPEQLGQIRMAAMQQFLEDFPQGLAAGRYQVEELPQLPYADGQFELALCSHFLFSYSDHFSESFHLSAVRELCRVAQEVRIFPLLKVSGERSPFVQPIVSALEQSGYTVTIETVDYEFQKEGNQQMRCRRTDL